MVIAFNGLGCSLSLLAPTGDFGENVPPAAHFSHQLEKWAVGDTFLIQKSYGKKVTRRRQNNAHKRLKVSTRPPDGRNLLLSGGLLGKRSKAAALKTASYSCPL